MFPSHWFRVILTLLLSIVTFCGITMTNFSNAGSSERLDALPTPSINAPQAREGICNRGEGPYPCLLTENPNACPADTHAVLYRAATCAPCVENSSDCPCVPNLYECQQC